MHGTELLEMSCSTKQDMRSICWVRAASSTWNVFWFGKTTRWRFQPL